MNGVHDLGGMHGFGPIEPETNEQVFHSRWEARLFAIRLALIGAGHWHVDEFRRSIEQMPPAAYLAATYYERWLYGLECLLIEKQIISIDELKRLQHLLLEGRNPQIASAVNLIVPKTGEGAIIKSRISVADTGQSMTCEARFRPRDVVIARNINTNRHTRLPRYIRGKRGVVRRDWGVFAFPDTRAHGLGNNLQHCYSVEFRGRDVWGEDHSSGELVYLDLWEDYLIALDDADDRSTDN